MKNIILILELLTILIALDFKISNLHAMAKPSVVITKENIKEQLGFDIKSSENTVQKEKHNEKSDTQGTCTEEVKKSFQKLKWKDDNRFKGRNIVLRSCYDYILKLGFYLESYQHLITEEEIDEYGKVAFEYQFTEQQLEQVVFDAYEEARNNGRDRISKADMDLVFRGCKNLRIIQKNQVERELNTPEGRARYFGEKTRDAIVLVFKIPFLTVQIIKNKLWPKEESISKENRGFLENMPEKHCYLEPFLAGDQPQEICSLIRSFTDELFHGSKDNVILLYGSTGTGKTDIAKAIPEKLRQKGIKAKLLNREAPLLMTSVRGSGPAAVKKIFEEVKEILKADEYKMVIIFVDEVDALAPCSDVSTNLAVRATLNQFFVELSQCKRKDNVLLVFATSMYGMLDPWFLARVKQIHVDLPDVEKLVEIFRFHLMEIDNDYSQENGRLEEPLKKYAKLAFDAKLSGRDVFNIVCEARRMSRNKKQTGIPEEMVFAAIKGYVAQKKQNEAKKTEQKA